MPTGTLGIWAMVISVAVVTGVAVLSLRQKSGKRVRWLLAAVALALAARYLIWRGLSGLNLSSPDVFISLPLFVAEVYFGIQLSLFVLQALRVPPRRSEPLPPAKSPWVDVFIATYNEPLDIIRRTVVACSELEYSKKTIYLLDDGNRPQVKAMAEALGIRYLTRPDNLGAKGGNINAALNRTDGEFVVMFDADHIPVRTFLTETLGFFSDPKVAFVQTVQHFYNSDPFQRNLRLGDRIPHEQSLFFDVIMPGKDAYGAAFWTGTGAVFRREALEELGGVLSPTVTEDFHTSLELNRRGWRSVHLNRPLSAGLAPESFAGYLSQRLRWTHGMFSVWWKSNPLITSGLTLGQRLCHVAAVYYFMYGLARLPFLAAPLTFLFWGLEPVDATIGEFLAYYVPAYVSLFVIFPVISNGKRMTLASEVYETATCLVQAPAALIALAVPRRRAFKVTPKGLEHSSPRLNILLAAPQACVLGLCVAGLLKGTLDLSRGLPQPQMDATIINMVWTFYNAFLCLAAVAIAREQPQARGVFSRKLRLNCHFQLDTSVLSGEVVSMNTHGATLMTVWSGPLPGLFSLKIFGKDGETIELTAQRVAARMVGNSGTSLQKVEVRFLLGSASKYTEVDRFLFHSPWAWEDEPTPTRQVWRGLAALMMAPLIVWIPQIRRPRKVSIARPRVSPRPAMVDG
ncbi:MAG: glycosyltransferase [SAR202 cluster bacterium]|nr:glycosyltransferase [SAR202 cluster bacterium]